MKGLKGETEVIPDTAATNTLEPISRSEGTDEIEPEPETEVKKPKTLETSSRSESKDEIEVEPETEVKKPKTEVNDSGFKHFTEKPTIEAETSEKEESKTEDSTERTKIVKRHANEQK